MWKIFSEIKKWCDVIKIGFCLLLALVKCIFALTYLGSWNPTDIIESLMDDTIFWQSYPSPVRWNLSGTLHISTPRSFPTSISHPLFSALSVFHPWWHGLPWLRFHSLKTKQRTKRGTMKEREAGIVQQERPHKQTDNWVWRCHSHLLASHSFTLTFFPSFFAFSFTALYILSGGKTEHPFTWWYVAVKRSTLHKPQSWLKTVKSHHPL